MNIFKLSLLMVKLDKLEKGYNQTKTNKVQLLNEIINLIKQIEGLLHGLEYANNKKKNEYEIRKMHYNNLSFDRCFMFLTLKKLIEIHGEEYASKRFEYTEGSNSRGLGGMEEYHNRKVEFSILARKEVIDSLIKRYEGEKLSSTRQVISIIDKLIEERETFFVYLSDNMTRLPISITSCPQQEINTTDINLWPITLYEPKGTDKSQIVDAIKSYAAVHGTDFDIGTFIDSYKSDPSKYLEKK